MLDENIKPELKEDMAKHLRTQLEAVIEMADPLQFQIFYREHCEAVRTVGLADKINPQLSALCKRLNNGCFERQSEPIDLSKCNIETEPGMHD